MTFICSSSRPSGALSIRSTTRLSVSMLTTGKTSEESQTCTSMSVIRFATTGSQELSSPSTSKDAQTKQAVDTLTGGRNRSIILSSTRLNLAKRKETRSNAPEASSAPSITQVRTADRAKSPCNRETGRISNTTRSLRCR